MKSLKIPQSLVFIIFAIFSSQTVTQTLQLALHTSPRQPTPLPLPSPGATAPPSHPLGLLPATVVASSLLPTNKNPNLVLPCLLPRHDLLPDLVRHQQALSGLVSELPTSCRPLWRLDATHNKSTRLRFKSELMFATRFEFNHN